MADPFEEKDANHTVLRDDEDQHSLWPAFAPAPEGWTVPPGPGHRDECMAHVREQWADLRPRSVTDFVAARQTG